MKVRRNYYIVLFFILLSISWKICESQPMYDRYGPYHHRYHHHHGPPPPPPYSLGMRPRRPIIPSPVPIVVPTPVVIRKPVPVHVPSPVPVPVPGLYGRRDYHHHHYGR